MGPRSGDIRPRPLRTAGLLVGLVGLAVGLDAFVGAGWSLYGALAMTAFGLKAGLSFRESPLGEAPQGVSVAAVIACFNEDPVVVERTVYRLAHQCDLVVVVDDGSSVPLADQLQVLPPNAIVTRTDNAGKREALRVAVRMTAGILDADFYVTVDSDTVVGRRAVQEGLRHFSGRGERGDRVGAVTGTTRALNWNRNLLTLLQDIRYSGAFLWERAAYSSLGSVLCVCGSFTIWRGPLLEDLMDPLCDQRFGGRPCTYGDDRHLSNLALARGWRIEMSKRALAETLVPESVGHWFRQQIRWSKSFIRESLWSVRRLSGIPLVLAVAELLSWAVFSILLLLSSVVLLARGDRTAFALFAAWLLLSAWVRALRWFEIRSVSARDRAKAILVAPMFGVATLLAVVPIRLWALATMSNASWGTRTEVEVRSS